MRKQLIVGFLALAVCLTAASAVEGKCRKVWANGGASTNPDTCSYDGIDYVWCFESQVMGTLNGTWYFYGNPEFNCFEMTVPGDIEGIPGPWDLWACWALAVFETNRGDILAQETDLLHLDVYFSEGAAVSLSNIIGGTGAYEGATGWIAAMGSETGGNVLTGEVCTP